MNFFVFWKNEAGEDELITPPLDGTILPGVTRDSILTLTRELNQFKVVTKPYKIQELIKACKEKCRFADSMNSFSLPKYIIT